MNINIETNTTQQLTTAEVDLLAKHLCGVKLTLADSGVPTYNILSVTQQQGGLNASCSAVYKDAVDALALKGINVSYTTLYIRILDPEVFNVLDSINIGDGTGITIAQAATADLKTAFKNNTQILAFDEIGYFSSAIASKNYNFSGCTNLNRINLNAFTAYITDGFVGCSNLRYFGGLGSTEGEFIINNSVTSIPTRAFKGLSGITSITFPSSIVSCGGSNVFEGCTGIQTLNIENLDSWANISFGALTSHPAYASSPVYKVNGLPITTYEHNLNLTSIKNYIFYKCGTLTSITIPSGVTSIGTDAFAGCTNLNAIYVDSLEDWLGITFTYQPLQLAHNLYINGSLVQNVTIPSGTNLTNKFRDSTSLTSVTLDSGITSIGGSAFNSCTALTTINIPSGVTSIGQNAFDGCTSLEITDLSLPNLTSLGSYAFRNTKIQQISNLGSITSIPQYCFNGCTALTSVTLPNSVTSIGNYAFGSCTNLSSITIPNSVTTFGSYAFANCKMLTTINLGNNVVLGDNSFGGCSSLEYFGGPNSTAGELDTSNIKSISGWLTFNCAKLKTLFLSSNTNMTNSHLTFRYSGLTSVTFANDLTTIPHEAFMQTQLTSVIIPSSVQTIKSLAFRYCNKLSSVTIYATTPPTLETSAFDNNAAGRKFYVPAESVNAYKTASGWSTYAADIEAIPTT